MCPISRLITALIYKSLAWVVIIHVEGKNNHQQLVVFEYHRDQEPVCVV